MMIATTQPNLLYLLSEFKVYMESSRCQVDVEVPAGRCSFDCLYFCWRFGLPRDVVFLT